MVSLDVGKVPKVFEKVFAVVLLRPRVVPRVVVRVGVVERAPFDDLKVARAEDLVVSLVYEGTAAAVAAAVLSLVLVLRVRRLLRRLLVRGVMLRPALHSFGPLEWPLQLLLTVTVAIPAAAAVPGIGRPPPPAGVGLLPLAERRPGVREKVRLYVVPEPFLDSKLAFPPRGASPGDLVRSP
jgi:hypothetical protein